MIRCNDKPNYSTKEYDGSLIFDFDTNSNLSEDDVTNIIVNTLNNLAFSTKIDESDDLLNYEDSIKTLVKDITKKIKKQLPKSINLKEVQVQLELRLLPKPLTKFEQKIIKTISIPDSELKSEKERTETTYKEILYSVYGNSNRGIDRWREMLFIDQIHKRTIINQDKREIIDSNYQLANNLIDYLNQLYKTIRDYLISEYGFLSTDLPVNLYRKNPKTHVSERVSTYTSTLLAMYNIIELKRNSDTLDNELINGWSKSISNKTDPFYDAVMAYINLVYFDDILNLIAGDFINIDNDLDSPIETVDVGDYKYKYTTAAGNSNLGKNFGVEFENSLDKMSKFSQVLISTIPIYSYETRQLEFGNLQAKDFIGTIVKLKDIGVRVPDSDFRNAIINLTTETSMNRGALQIIFKKLFKTRDNRTLIDKLNELDFNLADLSILYSVYKTVFDLDDSKSWLNIENKYLAEKGIKSRYNLVDTIFGIISSNSAMNYLLTTFDSYTNSYKSLVKEKYIINIPKFTIISNVNLDIANRGSNDNYRILDTTGYTRSVRIGNSVYIIELKNKTATLLDKDHLNFDVKNLVSTSNIDLSTYKNRENLLKSSNRTDEELKFMEILTFVDDMLGTNFSHSERGLHEFYLSHVSNRTFFKQIFLSASRALAVLNIYRDFRSARKPDGSKYALTELQSYLYSKTSVLPKSGNPTYRDYFSKLYNGELLKVIGNNENWTDTLSKILTILAGDSSRSTVSDLFGNKRPNSSPSFFGQELRAQIKQSGDTHGGAASYLMFSQRPFTIKRMVLDTDVELENGVKMSVRDMTEVELLQNSIIYKFWYPFTSGSVFILPTTFADKTKFIRAEIGIKDLEYNNQQLEQIAFSKNMNSTIESWMMDTVGEAYKAAYKSILDDYRKLFENDNLTEQEINDRLKGLTEEDLLKLVDTYNATHEDRLEFGPDLHYRKINRGLALNELLYEFANNLYTKEKLHLRILSEKRKFIKDLVDRIITFKVTNQLRPIIDNFTKSFKDFDKKWIKNGELILAKGKLDGKDVDIMYDMDENVSDLELNPLLDSYFMIDNLLGNNLRFLMTGSEVNHPNKAISKLSITKALTNLSIPYIKMFKQDFNNGDELTFFDLDLIIKNYLIRQANGEFNNLSEEESNRLLQFINRVLKLYNDSLYSFEVNSEAALFKRNVSIPATMTRMIPKLNGISETMNIACIEDVKAPVFNFDGKTGQIDSCDGMANVAPFWSILENKSLNDSEVGWVKKPLHHAYDPKTMTATLLKYATSTITNLWIRQSEGNRNGIRLRNIFKKMTNFQWKPSDNIDLLRCDFKESGDFDFTQDILEGINLYYINGDQYYQITDFGREEGIYYTEEHEVDFAGNPIGKFKKVYHYFDNDGNHLPQETLINDPKYHTINSLFELHAALGGIYSATKNKDGFLQYSEASNFAVTNFIIHVATLKDGADPNDYSIKSYDQPLKNAMIHMIANHTTLKEGSRNMNPSSSWFDNTSLRYMTISTTYYGLQQDSDHEADLAFMTEFSQVINALDVGGYLHDYVVQIYRQLGQTALDLSQVELDAVSEFLETKDKNLIYEIIGKTMFANIRTGRHEVGLAEAIINKIKQTFNQSSNHIEDKLKIPFSDKNIYARILTTFVSNINRKSIKRLYPGLGMVMVGSYNMSMIYDFEGLIYQFEDLLKLAYKRGFKSELTDISAKNREVVFLMLSKALDKLSFSNLGSFMPTDNVVCYFTVETTNPQDGTITTTTHEERVSLNDLYDYYEFKNDPIAYLRKRGYSNISNLKFKKDITRPRDLAPAKILWKYKDKFGNEHTMNIFDHYKVKALILQIAEVENDNILSKDEKKRLINQYRKEAKLLNVFSDLKRKLQFTDENGDVYQIYDLQNLPAETIMSNLYKSIFGLQEDESLIDVINKGEKRFVTPSRIINSTHFDLAFTKRSGRHTYITFNSLEDTSENFNYRNRKWDNTVRRRRKDEDFDRIYATNRDNTILFEVGREITEIDPTTNELVKKRVNFVTRHLVTEVIGDRTVHYTLYNINRSAIKRILKKESYPDGYTITDPKTGKEYTITEDLKFEKDVDNFISSLLAKIYQSDSFGGILMNRELTLDSGGILRSTLHNFGIKLSYNPELSKYIFGILDLLKTTKPVGSYKINSKNLRNLINEYNKNIAKSIYTSFLRSLYFTSSRIPAQTLQSFMLMRNVGFTGVAEGQCFVSRWLTWLLGSDY